MLLNVVSLFCLEAVNLVSCSSSSSAGKQGITLGFSQTWKSFVFSQSSKIKKQYLSSFSFYMASIYSLYLSMELNYKTSLLFQRFPTNEWKALTVKHHMKREEILTENAVILRNSLRLEIKKLFTCKQPQLREKEELNTLQFHELLTKLQSSGDNHSKHCRSTESGGWKQIVSWK